MMMDLQQCYHSNIAGDVLMKYYKYITCFSPTLLSFSPVEPSPAKQYPFLLQILEYDTLENPTVSYYPVGSRTFNKTIIVPFHCKLVGPIFKDGEDRHVVMNMALKVSAGHATFF